jgi:two-component system sensor histidine kinase GlrK
MQLTELEDQKNRFLREVSHELKTPLTAIREGAELLNEGIAGQLSAQQREITSILHDNSVRLQRMIEDLLNYSSARFQTSPEMGTVALHEVLQQVLSDHALPISTRQIRPITSINKISLSGDKGKLATLCDNLVSNAVKFAPQGGTIRVVLHTEDNQAILEVMDNGPGISAEDQLHLFEPFFQGNAPQDSHVKGSGLGLSIALDCAMAHGGTIEIVDNPVWQGAHFRVTLPMEQTEHSEDEI